MVYLELNSVYNHLLQMGLHLEGKLLWMTPEERDEKGKGKVEEDLEEYDDDNGGNDVKTTLGSGSG